MRHPPANRTLMAQSRQADIKPRDRVPFYGFAGNAWRRRTAPAFPGTQCVQFREALIQRPFWYHSAR
jgi:hypothetical protein